MKTLELSRREVQKYLKYFVETAENEDLYLLMDSILDSKIEDFEILDKGKDDDVLIKLYGTKA